MTALFDRIAHSITSLGAVVFVMLLTITGMVFFSHTLFQDVFPDSMTTWEKSTATWTIAIAWELTVLLCTCNTDHLNKRIPLAMAIASGIIVLFFIQAFDASLSWLQIIQRLFVGILVATINYIYADLFYAKWKERKHLLHYPKQLQEAESRLLQIERELQEAKKKMHEDAPVIQTLRARLLELESYRTRVEAELTCPYCNTLQSAYGTLRSHLGHCKSKMSNLTK